MTNIKSKISRTKVMSELYDKAKTMYENSWQPDVSISAYMQGVKDLLKMLELPKNKQEEE